MIHIIDEAKHCLQCKNPQCRKGCPASTQVNVFIKMLLDGNIKQAGELLFDNNPLSLICSYVCDHEKQCEGHCILGKKGKPVHISSIENYISGYYLNLKKEHPIVQDKGKVAIIGSGPAGITIAILLAKRGYSVTIFEAMDKIGGIMRYGIPEFRLPKTVLDRYNQMLYGLGIKFRPNTTIGTGGITLDDLFRDGYRSVFVGTGVWKPNSLGIKGESLGNVHFAINYLKNPDVYNLGNSLAIIGAGNAAIDVARTAVRKGVENITIFFRKGEEHLTSSKYEVEYAKIEGIKFEYYKSPVEITDEGVIFSESVVHDPDDDSTIEVLENTEKLYPCDSAIIAISQGPRNFIASTTYGLDLNNRGLIKTDSEGRTSRPGVFASGDVVTGAKTVVEAMHVSKIVAKAIEEFIENEA